MKYMIQIFFSNNTQHNFTVERDNIDEIEDTLLEYRADKHDFVFAGSENQPCIFNLKNVILIVASQIKELEAEKVTTLCCEGERCHS